jgi:hypothetical protein
MLTESSSCPFLLTHLEISSSEAGSSAITLIISPMASRSISILVRNTGSGQYNPLTSIVFVGTMSLLALKEQIKWSSQDIKCLERF